MLFSILSCWSSVWWCQKTFWHVLPVFRVWYMIDNKLCQVQLYLFCIPCGTTLGWTGNCLWEVLWNQGQYCDGVVYQYIGMICCMCRPIFTWWVINPLGSSLVNFCHFIVLVSREWFVWARRCILVLSSHMALGFPSGLYPTEFSTKYRLHFSYHPYMLCAPPISFFLISSPK